MKNTHILENIVNSLPIAFYVVTEDGKKIYSNKQYEAISSVNENITQKTEKTSIYDSTLNQNLEITSIIDITTEINKQKERETSFAMIAHDLKSPLYAQKRAIELLLKEKLITLAPAQKEIITLLYNSNLYSLMLVSDILCAYKLENKNLQLNFQPFNLCEKISTCVQNLKYIAEERNIHFLTIIPKCCYIKGDQNEIQRVIMNLITNAIKYSAKGSEIKIYIQTNQNEVLFKIENIGEYISPQNLNNLFNKNFSLKNRYNKSGTGLGLYIAKNIIEKHQGEIIAKSFNSGLNVFGFKLKPYIESTINSSDNNTSHKY